MTMSERSTDVENVEAWSEIIRDVLWHAPEEKRAEILALATKNESVERKKRDECGGLQIMTAKDLSKKTPKIRQWNTIMLLKSLLVQVFVRNITNNHSSHDAERILFARHPYGTGSGFLEDYIGDLVLFKGRAR